MNSSKQHHRGIGLGWSALLSAVLGLLLLVLTLLVGNLRWSLGAEKAKLMWFEHVRSALGLGTGPMVMADSLLLVDVHYDRVLTTLRDADGLPGGTEATVDHEHLLRLLQEIEATGGYRYVVLDVFLDAEARQPADSALCQLISHMPRIVVAKSGKPLADSCLLPKAGMAMYATPLWDSDFVKYPYFSGGERSLPLVMYEELTGRSIDTSGLVSTDSGWPVRSSVVLTYALKEDSTLMSNRRYLDQMVADGPDEPLLDSPAMAHGKYVVIGDFVSDRHQTFLGEMSGALINFNAFLSLMHGHHRLSPGLLLFLFLVFSLLAFVTIHYSSFSRMVMWLGYPAVLLLACLIVYVASGQVYDVLWAWAFFYVLEKYTYIFNRLREARQPQRQ